MKSNEEMREFILKPDREMCKKSLKYFFVDVLGFLHNHHHESGKEGHEASQYYCVKDSRDDGKSVFFIA